MILATICIHGVRAMPVNVQPIPRGIVGGQVQFEYTDSMWAGLTKTVVFRAGNVTKDILNAGEVVDIPPEVVAEVGSSLKVSVYGEGTPTLWADLGRVRDAADPSGDESTDPTLPVWAQLQEQIDELKENGVPGGGPVGNQNAVLYTAQELTAEQQIQARDNIGIEDLLTKEITGASGINLNDGVYEIGRFGVTGNEYDNEGNYAFRNANYLPVEGGRTIVVYFDAAEWNGNKINWGVELVQYDSARAVIGNAKHYIENYRNNSKSTFTLDANAAFIRIHYNRNGEMVFEDMTAPKIAIYYVEDAVQEFVEYGADAETILMVRRDRVQGLIALAGKKIVYDGDSICAGSAANAGGGYARIIADLTGGEYVNHAVGGGRLCSGVADHHCVADNLPNLPTDGDIYCFQGGINDYWGNAVLGTYTPGDYTGVVDATTVCGALETIFRYALTNFPGKRVCFVITHKIQNTAYHANGAGNTFKDYRDAMAGICQKYSIPFYDAFSESGLNGWNDAQNNLYLTGNADGTPDGCHPNEDGYRLFYVDQLIELFESGRSSGSAEKGEPGKNGADGQPGKDGSSGKDGTSVTVESVSESTADGGSNVVTFSDGKTLTVKNGKTGADGKDGADGNDYVLTPADKEEIAELAAGLVEAPEGSGGGIAVTGATVGQTVKISAVDENGVPTAWEPVDFPNGGGGSGDSVETIWEITISEEAVLTVEHTFTDEEVEKINTARMVNFSFCTPDKYETGIQGVTFGVCRTSWYGYVHKFKNNVALSLQHNTRHVSSYRFIDNFKSGLYERVDTELFTGISANVKSTAHYGNILNNGNTDSLKAITTTEDGFPVGTVIKVEVIA